MAEECDQCDGSGDCWDCDGTGRSGDNHDADGECLECHGDGRCPSCDGSGLEDCGPESIQVTDDDGEAS